MQNRSWLRALPLACLLGTGCAAKAPPVSPAGFIPAEFLAPPRDLPFHQAWRKPGLNLAPYRRIHVAAVNIAYLPKMNWWKTLERGNRFRADAEKLAEYARRTFQAAFREDPRQRFEVIEDPGPETLLLEVALVEVVPSKIVLNALGYAPFVGSVFKLIRNTKSKSSVAFEARLRDAESGEILALFADREFEKMSPVNVKDLTWYGHAESILYEWARQMVRALSKPDEEILPDSKPFHLKPW